MSLMNKKSPQKVAFSQNFHFTQPGGHVRRCCEAEVGRCLRNLRDEHRLSLRALAERSGLSVNTLSLIENGKSSPSISTLQKISSAMNVPMVVFFLDDRVEKKVACTHQGERKKLTFKSVVLEDLGEGMPGVSLEAFLVSLEPGANSGSKPVMHNGYELVYCLEGRIAYIIENTQYILQPGDSLFFESNLPHCWQNLESGPSQKLLVLCPFEKGDLLVDRHFLSQ
jgi:transcriptional regulator with XRE-family HTH domain